MKNYKLLFLLGISTCFSSAVFSSVDPSDLSLSSVATAEAESYFADSLPPVAMCTGATTLEKKDRYSPIKITGLRDRAERRAEAIVHQTEFAIDKQDEKELQALLDLYGFEAICNAWERGFGITVVALTTGKKYCCHNILDYASDIPDSEKSGNIFGILLLALAQETKAVVDANSEKYSKRRLKKLLDHYRLQQINTALKTLGINDILEYAVATAGLDNQITLFLLQHYTQVAVDNDDLSTIQNLYRRYGAEHIDNAWLANKRVLKAAWLTLKPTRWCTSLFDYAFAHAKKDKRDVLNWLISLLESKSRSSS